MIAKHSIKSFVFLIWIFSLLNSSCFASSSDSMDEATELAKKSQNPVEKMVTIPFNNNFNFNYALTNHTQYILDIKPVIPFALNHHWNLITRTIIPVIHQPDLYPTRGDLNGIGDITPSLFFSPANPGTVIWGLGPIFALPTASNKQLGQGKYSLGPTFVILSMPGSWVFGFLTYNIWSVAGDHNRPYVNEFEFQYFINYNFPHGWYLTTAPTITANWQAKSNNRWTVPFGIGGGHVFKIGKQPINISVQAYDNVKSPKLVGADWQLQLNISFLFPE